MYYLLGIISFAVGLFSVFYFGEKGVEEKLKKEQIKEQKVLIKEIPEKVIKNDKVIIKTSEGTIKNKKENILRCKFNTYLKNNVKILSNETREKIVENILKTKNPEIIFSIIKNESSFKWWIYSNVKIKISNKLIETRSIGLGSIIWEWWKPELVKNNITSKSDLYIIEKNIKATDVVFQYLLKRNKGDYKKAILDYFGGNKTWYLKRVLQTIGEINIIKIEKG